MKEILTVQKNLDFCPDDHASEYGALGIDRLGETTTYTPVIKAYQ